MLLSIRIGAGTQQHFLIYSYYFKKYFSYPFFVRWIYASREFESLHAIRLFEYSPTRKGENAQKYLDGYTGYLHTDDYAGYNQVPHVKRCLCWAHARRKFVEVTVGGIDSEADTLRLRFDSEIRANKKGSRAFFS